MAHIQALLLAAMATGGAAQDPALEALLISSALEGTVQVLPQPGAPPDVVLRLDEGPGRLVVSEDGRHVLVAHPGVEAPGDSITLLDVPARRVARVVPLTYLDDEGEARRVHRPRGVAFVPGAWKALVTVESDRVLLVVDLSNGQVEQAIDLGAYGGDDVLVTPDGTRAFVSHPAQGSVAVVDLNQGRLARTIDVGGGSSSMTLRPGHGELWVANAGTDSISVLDLASAEVREEFPVGAHPGSVAFTPDGKRALICNLRSSSVSVYDADRHSVLAEVRMGSVSEAVAVQRPGPGGLDFGRSVLPMDALVHPAGKRFWVACRRSDEVVEVDLGTYQVVARHSVDRGPVALAWSRFELPRVEAK